MPKYDQTGPLGLGPKTGRSFGLCGIGQRAGKCFYRYWPNTKDDKLKALESYKKTLEEELEDVIKEHELLNEGK